MATGISSSKNAPLPRVLLCATGWHISSDAHNVLIFLSNLSKPFTPQQIQALPQRFVLHLAGALRLYLWEAQGFFMHRQAGLPEARDAIRHAFQSLVDPTIDSVAFGQAVFRIWLDHFAWDSQVELGLDISLDDIDEELLLESMADFLWAHRPR